MSPAQGTAWAGHIKPSTTNNSHAKSWSYRKANFQHITETISQIHEFKWMYTHKQPLQKFSYFYAIKILTLLQWDLFQCLTTSKEIKENARYILYKTPPLLVEEFHINTYILFSWVLMNTTFQQRKANNYVLCLQWYIPQPNTKPSGSQQVHGIQKELTWKWDYMKWMEIACQINKWSWTPAAIFKP